MSIMTIGQPRNANLDSLSELGYTEQGTVKMTDANTFNVIPDSDGILVGTDFKLIQVNNELQIQQKISGVWTAIAKFSQ